MPNFLYKAISGSAFIFLAWLTIQCPCSRLLCCHLGTFWVALAVAVSVVLWANGGFKFTDPTCYADLVAST
jgi:hypothetical protein